MVEAAVPKSSRHRDSAGEERQQVLTGAALTGKGGQAPRGCQQSAISRRRSAKGLPGQSG